MSDEKEIALIARRLTEHYQSRRLGFARLATYDEHQHFIEVAKKIVLGLPVEEIYPPTEYKPCIHCGK